MSFEITALQIAYEMQRNKKYYTRKGLATAMGIQYQYAAKIFIELEKNNIYTILTHEAPYSIRVVSIGAELPGQKYDVKTSRDGSAKTRNDLWSNLLGVKSNAGGY